MQAVFQVVDELSDTDRGTGGFGSTGYHKDDEKPIKEDKPPSEIAAPKLSELEPSEVTSPTPIEEPTEDLEVPEELVEEEVSDMKIIARDTNDALAEVEEQLPEMLKPDKGLREVVAEAIISDDIQQEAEKLTEEAIVEESLSTTDLEVTQDIEEELTEPVSLETQDTDSETYQKYSPMFDQAVTAYCSDQTKKELLELVETALPLEDIKTRVILRIVENQIHDKKTVLVNELDEVVLDIIKNA